MTIASSTKTSTKLQPNRCQLSHLPAPAYDDTLPTRPAVSSTTISGQEAGVDNYDSPVGAPVVVHGRAFRGSPPAGEGHNIIPTRMPHATATSAQLDIKHNNHATSSGTTTTTSTAKKPSGTSSASSRRTQPEAGQQSLHRGEPSSSFSDPRYYQHMHGQHQGQYELQHLRRPQETINMAGLSSSSSRDMVPPRREATHQEVNQIVRNSSSSAIPFVPRSPSTSPGACPSWLQNPSDDRERMFRPLAREGKHQKDAVLYSSSSLASSGSKGKSRTFTGNQTFSAFRQARSKTSEDDQLRGGSAAESSTRVDGADIELSNRCGPSWSSRL
ncbi:unnamed protein product [Amoebophrya sp. A25]|nr:unnamed protein product [Amoebophrya sp. A25]|eukprot:GSA25T00013918001.1